jgi:hypothetical protein
MVRPVETIRKDLEALGEATGTLADEFSQTYATYLTVLGHALRRQVVMATYHLCTQVYPEEFLALAVSDRARLQQGMQTLGRQGQGWLQQLLEPGQLRLPPSRRLDRDDLSRLEAALVALAKPSATESASQDAAAAETAAAQTSGEGDPELALGEAAPEVLSSSDQEEGEAAAETDPELDPEGLVQSVVLAAMAGDGATGSEGVLRDRPFTGDDLTPTVVAKHHLMMEHMLREVLQRVSKQANRLLRQAGVLPDLPEALLEMATEADIGVPKGRSVPNVLNVMVAMAAEVAAELERRDRPGEDEADDEEEDDDDDDGSANMTHLAAIHLRLADLEFGDVQVALWRSKLRTAVGRLRKLGKQYQRAERELAIAQAEQAWRSVWYADSDGSPR